jgi:hypothetical protein
VAVPTGEVETMDCGLVITSIGYKSLPIDPAVPFDPRKAIVPNSLGRVQQAAGTHGGGDLQIHAYIYVLQQSHGEVSCRDMHVSIGLL